MSKVHDATFIIFMSIALAAMIFMALTFYTEAFLHRGMLFIEPNLVVATGEFGTMMLGFVAGTALLVWFYRSKP